MSNWPFRFLHAADLHLEQPPFGVAEVPDHLRQLFVEASYVAAERVFQAAVSEGAEFLVLSGDVLDPQRTGPRGPRFLVDQFERLEAKSLGVYWAGGRVDSPQAWPAMLALPKNVRVFPAGRPQDFIHRHDDQPLARLIGASRIRGGKIRAADFDADSDDLFTIAVAYGRATAESLERRAVDYWALGGRHAAHTLLGAPHVAHYPGSPQGRAPAETGPHGCTLVEVDGQRHVRTAMVPTDVLRWHRERVEIDETTTRDDLELLLHERAEALKGSLSGLDGLVTWKVVGDGPLAAQLRRGALVAELLESLRKHYGFGPPALWSASLGIEAPSELPPAWYEQETILGDFLTQIRRYQMNSGEPIDLEDFLSEEQLAGTLGAVAAVDSDERERMLREAAILGVDLLSGEGSQS
jgi:hypothetical protein